MITLCGFNCTPSKEEFVFYLTIEINDSKNSGRNVVAGDALVFAVDGVVKGSVAVTDHAQSRPHSQGVEITAVPRKSNFKLTEYDELLTT